MRQAINAVPENVAVKKKFPANADRTKMPQSVAVKKQLLLPVSAVKANVAKIPVNASKRPLFKGVNNDT